MNGWTGAQYSLLRLLWAVGLCGYLAPALLSGPAGDVAAFGAVIAAAVVVVLSAMLAIGWYDRTAALGLLSCSIYVWWLLDPPVSGVALVVVVCVLLLHLLMPVAPYGSVARMSRVDPGTFWRMPTGIYSAAWAGLAAVYAYGGVMAFSHFEGRGGSAAVGLVEILLAVLALRRRRRAPLWIAMVTAQLGLAAAGDTGIANLPVLMLLGLAFDPGWVPCTPGRRLRIFYDGDCGLCHRVVRFVLSEDREGSDFRFAPLWQEAFERVVPRADRLGLPDSVVVMRADGVLLVRSQAMLEIGCRLGGLWRLLAVVAAGVPGGWRDGCYDLVAGFRKRLFARPEAACPLLPPYLRGRFQPDASRG